MPDPDQKPPTPVWIKAVLTFWWVTLPLTLPFIAFSGMAADAGDHWYVDVFIGAALTYPLSIVISTLLRRFHPAVIFLPLVNVIVWLLSGTLPFM